MRSGQPPMPLASGLGFTLLEVMIGLAILGVALVVLVRMAAISMNGGYDAQMMGIATELSRSKMNDLEEMLLKEGFTDSDQAEGECGESQPRVPLTASSSGGPKDQFDVAARDLAERERAIRARWRSGKPFEEEGWSTLSYTYRIEQVELPSWQEIQAMAQAQGSAGSAAGSDTEGGFQDSALGGLLSQLGGGFGGADAGNIDALQGAAFIQSQYSLVQEVLKASIRKATVCVYYEVSGRPHEMKTVAYFTDPAAMDKVLAGLGAQDLDDQPQPGAGPGSGAPGAGSGTPGDGGRPSQRDQRR
jgi:prepilin-type N-terminal cleavage/methylation domain-containing protein